MVEYFRSFVLYQISEQYEQQHQTGIIEIFIETPKKLELQSAIWSEYNHHNTLKFLVCIAPNSTITFVSKAYPGRIKDEEITLKSVFLDMLSSYSNVMVEKGFNLISQYPLAGEVHHR